MLDSVKNGRVVSESDGWVGRETAEWARARGLPCMHFECVTSTNDRAKDDFANTAGAFAGSFASPPPVALYVADEQSGGRGRGEHKWTQASPGAAMLTTWSFKTLSAPQPTLAPLVGLAIIQALQITFPSRAFSLKAPNDVFLDDQKLAGTLLEAAEEGVSRRTAIGIGLNVLSAPACCAFKAIALASSGYKIDRATWQNFLAALFKNLIEAVEHGQRSELSVRSRASLRDALNLRPSLPSPILDVDARGQLLTAGGLLRWQDL